MTQINKSVLLALCLLAALALIAPATSAAAGPNIELSKEQPAQALLGTQQEVTLRASNPKGEARAYNLTLRDALPKGVKYVGPATGSDGSTDAPKVLEDEPAEGETTLIFENVADLSANSHYALHFKVEATSPEYTVGSKYTDHAGAYVNEEARLVPKFDAEGLPEPTSFTGSAEASASTTLTAVEIKKTEPSPEQELLRGVHEHQTVYTLKLINNEVGPTKELAVDDYLPAGLEFLGCGSVDHTTEAPTNTGSKEEYPGSGEIFPGNDPAAEKCGEPNSVETEEVDPPGPQPKGVYTHVRWTGLGELNPGQELELQYRAAIPIRENTLSWPHGKPAAGSLGQAANLDNNSGPETTDEEALTNVSTVTGKYQGTIATEDSDERTVLAEDLAVQKSVDKATIGAGQLSEWTLRLETSEYRYSNDIEIEDVLPNGLCPLGEEPNYEGPTIGSPTDPEPECEDKGVDLPTSGYSSVQEQTNGSFILKWNDETVPQLEHMAPSTVFQITFPTHTRVDYQKNFEPEKPVLTGDHWSNHVEIEGPSFARCTPKAQAGCEGGGTHIAAARPEGEVIKDVSAAEQKAGGVTIDKTVRENGGAIPVNCSEGEYVDGLAKPFPLYGPGDQICWKLVVDFNANLFSGEPVVTDFLPPEQGYVGGSIVAGPNNTVTATPELGEAANGVIKWVINGGEAVESEKVFEFLFKTEMQTSMNASPKDITGNLMKFSYANTEGETFPLRDLAEVERQEPELSLEKEITEVGGKSTPKTPEGGKSSAVAGGGEVVKYELRVENAGTLGAEEAEVWDVLPEGIKCEAVTNTVPAAGCSEGIIKWTGVTVPVGGLTSLTYEMEVPTNVAPGHAFVNHAGVTRYKTPTNTGGKFEYIPAENIDKALTNSNTGPLLDEAEVKTTAATLEKKAVSETEQPGNNASQATIGELVDYTVTAKIPAESKLYGTPVLTDVLPAGLEKVGAAAAQLDGAALPPGMTLEQLTDGAEVKFGGAYPETVDAQEHVLVLTLKARVRDIAANKRGVTLTNSASFEFKDVEEGKPTVLTKTAGTPLVEPRLEVTKTLLPGGRSTIVAPGEVVEYEAEVSDLAGTSVSTANEVTVTDTVPAGMKVVDPGPKGTAVGNTITWHLGAIAPGAAEHLVYKLEVIKPASAASSFTNVVVGETQSLPDESGGAVPAQTRDASFEEGAYEAANEGYEKEAKNKVSLIGATVSKEVTPTKGTIGSELTYTLHMNLPGEIKYFNTTLVDRLPDGVTFDEFLGSECHGEGCTSGEEIGAETQPDGTTLIGWYFGNFEAGNPRELVLRFKAHIDDVKAGGAEVKAPEALTNQVVGVYNETEGTKPTKVPVPGSSGFSEETNVGEATTTVAEPNVTLTKAVTAAPALVGGVAQANSKLTYTLTVSNTGSWDAHEVEVADTNTTANLRNVTPVEGAPWVESTAGPLLWIVPTIEAGKSVTLTYTAELPASTAVHQGEKVDNAAEVPTYFGLPKGEREAAEAPREYEGPKTGANLEVELPTIHVEKTTGQAGFPEPGTAEVGKPFPWRVVVENEAAVAGAKAVSVEDVLPPNWKYVAGSSTFNAIGGATVASPAFDPSLAGAGTQTLTWANVATLLPAGASVEILFEATPTVAALGNLEGLLQENTAFGSFEDLTGANESAEGPYAGEDIAAAELLKPELEIEKTPDGGHTVAGSTDKYEIKVSNGGTGTAHEVEVKDVLSVGQELVGPANANPSTGFAQKSVETDTPGPGETTVLWTIAEVTTATPVTIEVPIKTQPSLNDGDHVTDLATARSPQQAAEPSDAGSFEVHREADLSIEKKALESSVNAGEDIHYELVVKNHGPSDATGIVVTDELPENTILKSADPSCEEAGGTVTCHRPGLEVGKEHIFAFTVEVESGTTEPIENTAKVEGGQPDPGPEPNESTKVTPIGGLANLAIEKIGPEKPVLLGNDFTYEIKVENEGPSDAVNAKVEDRLPPQVRFVSAATSVGTCDEAPAELLTCDLERMRPHAEATITVTVEAAELGSFANVATFDSETSPEPKEGEAPAEIVPAADLTIEKTAPATVEPDGKLTYELHVENQGPSVAHKVKVTDPLPAGVDFVSAGEGCAAAGTTVTCEVAGGELAVGDSADFEVTVHVPFALGGQSLTNSASVAGEEGDPHPEDDTDTATTTVAPAADLSITKTMGKAEAGKPLTYTLAVTNKGPSNSSAVTVTDTLPAGTGFKSAAPSQGTCSASGQQITCQLGPLAAGGSAQVSITVEVAATATGSLRNVAKVEGPEPDPDKSNNESAVEGPIKPQDPADPNLKVVKTADTSSPAIGVPFQYRVDISNLSGGEAKNVKVVDTLSGPVKVLSIDAEAGHCGAAGSKITCQIPSIPVGKTVHVTYSVVAEAAGPLKNTVSAQAGNGEMAPQNNHAVKAVHVKDPPAPYTLTKTASRKVVPGGKTVGFTITLRTGAAALVDAKVCDRLPAALVFVKAAGARYVNGEACWTKKYVAAHKVLRLHLLARAVKGYKSRVVRNVATASAENGARRSAAATVRVKPAFAGKPGGVTG